MAGAGGTSGYSEQGALLTGAYTLSKDSTLAICVGQMGGVVGASGRSGSGGTFVTNVQSINTTSLVSAVPLFIAGGAGGVGLNNGLQTASASLTNTGKNGFQGAAGGIGPNSGSDAIGYGGGGVNSFKIYGGSIGGAFGLGGAKGYDNGGGGGGGGYGGGGGGGGQQGGSGGGGGLYDITYLYNCSATNSGQGYVIVDTNIRFALSNVISIFLFTSPTGSSTFIPITYINPNPYNLVPTYTSSPSISGISLTSPSVNGVFVTAAQDTAQTSTSFTITPTYGTYSNSITISVSCGPSTNFYIIPITRIFYTAYNSYINIALNNPYGATPQWSLTPSIDGSTITTTNTNMRVSYSGAAFAQQNMTVQAAVGSSVYTQNFALQTNPTVLTLAPVAMGTVQNKVTGVSAYNTSESYQAFDTRGTGGGAFPNTVLLASSGDTITTIFNIVYADQTWSYKSVWIHNGTSWAYNPLAVTTNQVPTVGTDYTYTFTIPSLTPGLYSIIFMNSYYGQNSPTASDISRTYSESVLIINDYSPGYVLSNPGTTNLNTMTSQAQLVLTLTNPYNAPPTWSYPTISGATWSTTNTSITLTAPQGTAYATNTITVQASYLTYNYPQSFSLTLFSTPGYVLSNPGTTTLNTMTSQQQLTLTLTNPLNLTPTWSYPVIPGATWSTTNTSITLTAPQGTDYATNSITVQASYLTYNYPQTFSLTISAAPGFVLSNPGPTTIYTLSGQKTLTLTLTNPTNVTPTWSYPTITGATWSTTNTSITLTAPQGTAYATNTITVQASYLTYNYPQSFSLTINNTTKYVDGIVTTFVGGFFYPYGITHDQTNTLYVSDSNNSVIKKVNATTAAVTSLVGLSVWAVAYDGSTYIYATDNNNHVIYRINASSGAYTVFAGTSGSSGSADGTGAAARFNFPTGITYDSAGFMYLTDTNNCTIRKITTGGVVTTLAGTAGSTGSTNGTGAAARFTFPTGLVYDGSANIYVCDTSNSIIRQVTTAGVVTTIAGTAGSTGSTDGTGAAARFNNPNGLTYDGTSKLYISDTANSIIRLLVISTNAVTTIAGLAGNRGSTNGTGSAARFDRPYDITCNKATSILYVLDTFNQSVRKII
jgi:hypothetical protein